MLLGSLECGHALSSRVELVSDNATLYCSQCSSANLQPVAETNLDVSSIYTLSLRSLYPS